MYIPESYKSDIKEAAAREVDLMLNLYRQGFTTDGEARKAMDVLNKRLDGYSVTVRSRGFSLEIDIGREAGQFESRRGKAHIRTRLGGTLRLEDVTTTTLHEQQEAVSAEK